MEEKTAHSATMASLAWPHVTAYRYVGGALVLADGRLKFTTFEGECQLDEPTSVLSNLRSPWYYFGSGVKLDSGGQTWRFEWAPPRGETGNPLDATNRAKVLGGRIVGAFELPALVGFIGKARAAGKAWWKELNEAGISRRKA